MQGVIGNVLGLSVSSEGFVATIAADQVLKVFNIKDLAAKSYGSHRFTLSRSPIDVAFGAPSDIFVLSEVRAQPESPCKVGELAGMDEKLH